MGLYSTHRTNISIKLCYALFFCIENAHYSSTYLRIQSTHYSRMLLYIHYTELKYDSGPVVHTKEVSIEIQLNQVQNE